MHGTFHHMGASRPIDPEDIMFALKNEVYAGQPVAYQGRAYSILIVERGLAWLAGLVNPVPVSKLVQLG